MNEKQNMLKTLTTPTNESLSNFGRVPWSHYRAHYKINHSSNNDGDQKILWTNFIRQVLDLFLTLFFSVH